MSPTDDFLPGFVVVEPWAPSGYVEYVRVSTQDIPQTLLELRGRAGGQYAALWAPLASRRVIEVGRRGTWLWAAVYDVVTGDLLQEGKVTSVRPRQVLGRVPPLLWHRDTDEALWWYLDTDTALRCPTSVQEAAVVAA